MAREIRSRSYNDTANPPPPPCKRKRWLARGTRRRKKGVRKVSRRRRKFVIYKINIRQLFLGPPLAERGWWVARVVGSGGGGVVKTAIAKTRNAETRNQAESLEFTAPTYWLRKHTKLRLVKHSSDTCPTPAYPSPLACLAVSLPPRAPAALYLASEMFDGRSDLSSALEKFSWNISDDATDAEKVAAVSANFAWKGAKNVCPDLDTRSSARWNNATPYKRDLIFHTTVSAGVFLFFRSPSFLRAGRRAAGEMHPLFATYEWTPYGRRTSIFLFGF